MKKLLFCSTLMLIAFVFYAQSPGDTVVVKAFKYGSSTRDTLIQFPGNLSYEKVILKYNMRCKNALVSSQSSPDLGCGQWDGSCNTFLVDSSRIEKALNTHPSHIIPNFSGVVFPYVTQPVYDYYNYSQTSVALSSITSETQYTLGTGTVSVPTLLKSDEKAGRSQLLFTATELLAAGFSAGNIHGMLLEVSNSGGGVNFFKINIRHTSLTSLSSASVTLSGFTNVFNQNFSFTSGSNRLQFHTPFAWDGASNLLIDLSFTNTVPSNPVVFAGMNTSGNMQLYANNNYALDLSNLGSAMLNTSQLSGISNELSVTFWVYGDATKMPANTTLLYGYGNNPSERNLNIHLPWSDNSIFFDCGYAGGYDRINKASTATQQGGQWNHWAFTKNTVTGNMKIYLNGVLWHSGTGKTKAITLLNLILGNNNDFSNNYKGKINELTIWDKELTAADIVSWMNKPITAAHPFYTNLKAYYKLNEGTGSLISDTKNALTSTGVNLKWTYDRGHNLNRMFTETNLRPKVVLVQGTYSLSTSTVVTKDSVLRTPSIVQAYSITPGSGLQAGDDDLVTPTTTMSVYESKPSNVYNGDTGVLSGTIAVAPTGSVTISTLNYYKYHPYYIELLSFVTPYGIGLDLGPKGKSWYYDITDFTPLLKGRKRLMMDGGGINFEQLDIDFLFIVGTPPRNVLDFKQLWQGYARTGAIGIASILNNTSFAPVSFQSNSGGQRFKLRSTITGHGSEGEFESNGGQIDHYFNINGGATEYTWNISQNCSTNPVYPQGGTWLYNRQGWCPGRTSYTREMDLTPYITANSTYTLDYQCSSPPVASGAYDYIVANQVVTYGTPNHTLDAAIEDVLTPSNKVVHARINPICAKPRILVRNTGATLLTKLEVEYWLNTSNKQTYTWNGNLASMDTTIITLPIATLWQAGIQPSNNVFHAELKKANNTTDNYTFNNVYHSPFVVPEWLPSKFTIEFKTNNTTENSYKLYNDNGTLVATSNFTATNTVFKNDYDLNGCYTLIIEDTGQDGLSWWANSGQGNGYARIRNSSNTIIKTFQADFGSRLEYSFTTNAPLSVVKNDLDALLNLYPNPTQDQFILQGTALEAAQVQVSNVVGQAVSLPSVTNGDTMTFDTNSLTPGIYFVTVIKGSDSVTKKLVIH